MNRRDVLLGATCCAGLAAAEWLRPRRVVDLLGGRNLDAVFPRQFGRWRSSDGGDIVIPQNPGSLADRLYAKQMLRTYVGPDAPEPVMLLVAYGASQSDTLQLHRPEACYPAVGFTIARRQLVPIGVGPVALPAVLLTAQATGRVEDIAYWTRLGEYLPQTAAQQRRDRLSAGLDGYVGDGVLVRTSTVRAGGEPRYRMLEDFLREMVMATAPADRQVLIGTARARRLGGTV